MCGRFARKSTQEVLADWFGVELEDMPWFAASFNVAPQSVQPVVRVSRATGNREFALMRWGLVPAWILLANSIRLLLYRVYVLCLSTLCSQNRSGRLWNPVEDK